MAIIVVGPSLLVKKVRPNAQLPRRAHRWDAGYDLFAALDRCEIIPAGERRLIPTGIAVAIPPGYAGIIKDRSGWALKKGIHVLAGVIDAGYRGEVGVLIQNLSNEPIQICPGDRIAQLLVVPIFTEDVVEVEELPELDERGEKGWGSTGQ